MKREGDVITFGPENDEVLAKFERDIGGQQGAEFFIGGLLEAFHQASMRHQRAFLQVADLAAAAGVLDRATEQLTYHWDTEKLTVQKRKVSPGSDRDVRSLVCALREAKVGAVDALDFERAAALKDVGDSLRKIIKAPATPVATENTENTEDGGKQEAGADTAAG